MDSLLPMRMAFGEAELEAIRSVFDHYASSGLDYGYQGYFEQMYTDFFVEYQGGQGYADAVSSGTAAVYVALASLQLPKGSKVVVSPITDPGTINAIILQNLTPVVADAGEWSYNTNVNEILKVMDDSVRAIVIVHSAGKAVDMEPVMDFAKRNNLLVLEDCSQAHGARCKGRKVGTFGDIAAYSTMYRKAHATGGCGGLVYTQNEELYWLARAYADRGKPFSDPNFDAKTPSAFMFPALNFNLDEVSCAIGLCSLRKLDETMRRRIEFLQFLQSMMVVKLKRARMMFFSDQDSPFFQPIFVDSVENFGAIEMGRELIARGVTVNPRYDYVVSEWPWARSFLGPLSSSCPNAVATRNASFNLLFNENFSQIEAQSIVDFMEDIENTCMK